MNSFGRLFRVQVFGESHGSNLGVVLDGCPPGLPLTTETLNADLARRKAGAAGTTPRKEADEPVIISGTFNGCTTGTPITVLFENGNTRSADYDTLINHPRPGHADYTARVKYAGYNDPRGGGHFSARLTLGLVVAGTVARLIAKGVEITARVTEAGGSTDIEQAVQDALKESDTIGGLIECICRNVPAALGEPFFDSVESYIAHLAFAIPAVKGIEFGSGFASAAMRGSQHNDPIINESGATATNNAGGINGGITNGNDIVFRMAIKPASSIGKPQETYNFAHGEVEELLIGGRHDTCVALRAPVVVESIAAIAIADFLLIQKARDAAVTDNSK